MLALCKLLTCSEQVSTLSWASGSTCAVQGRHASPACSAQVNDLRCASQKIDWLGALALFPSDTGQTNTLPSASEGTFAAQGGNLLQHLVLHSTKIDLPRAPLCCVKSAKEHQKRVLLSICGCRHATAADKRVATEGHRMCDGAGHCVWQWILRCSHGKQWK